MHLGLSSCDLTKAGQRCRRRRRTRPGSATNPRPAGLRPDPPAVDPVPARPTHQRPFLDVHSATWRFIPGRSTLGPGLLGGAVCELSSLDPGAALELRCRAAASACAVQQRRIHGLELRPGNSCNAWDDCTLRGRLLEYAVQLYIVCAVRLDRVRLD